MSGGFSEVQLGWLEKWKQGTTPWHKPEVDHNIQDHLKELTKGEANVSILVTWCGKSLDLLWLCQQSCDVVGVELSEIAVKQLFEENSVPYSTKKLGEFTLYQAEDRKLKIFLGDYYKLTPDLAGTFDTAWDNNAFGSSPPADRQKYVSVLSSLLKPKGRVLLANWEYGKLVRDIYPYSLTSSEVKEYFKEMFDVQFLGKCEVFTEYFIKKFNVDFAHRNIHLLIVAN